MFLLLLDPTRVKKEKISVSVPLSLDLFLSASCGLAEAEGIPSKMEQPEPLDIQFTTKCLNPDFETALSYHSVLSCSQTVPELNSRRIDTSEGSKPIIEVVTVADTINLGAANGCPKVASGALEESISSIRGRHLIVHSEILS